MQKREFAAAVRSLASDAGLRQIPSRARAGNTWVGVYSGIFLVMHLDSVRLHLELTSPEQESDADTAAGDDQDGAVESDPNESDNEVVAFHRTSAAGLPGTWFEQNSGEPWGFQLVIDEQRRRMLAPEAMHGILDCIIQDLHDLGAEDSQPCSACENQAATLGYFEAITDGPRLAPFCNDCWEAARQTTRGVIKVNRPTRLLRGWAYLALGTVVMAAVWGYAQHPALEIPFPLLFMGCGGAGIAMALTTAWVAQGSNLSLRLGVVAGVSTATLAGNIVGLKLLMEAQGFVTPWSQLVPGYFLEYFPAHTGQELQFLSGGVVGVLIGFFSLRASERMRLR